MRLALLALLLAAPVRAEGTIVRQLVGLSASVSDSGIGVGAQLGIRMSPVLARVTLDLGGNGAERGYVLLSARGDWLLPLTDGTSLYAGAGIGSLTYGWIFDSPSATIGTLLPEAGVVFGPDRTIFRALLGVTVFVPLGAVSHEADYGGTRINPPHVMATLVLSL